MPRRGATQGPDPGATAGAGALHPATGSPGGPCVSRRGARESRGPVAHGPLARNVLILPGGGCAAMADTAAVIATIVFFAASIWYVRGCDHL